MAFSKSYVTDTVALAVVQQTVQAKNALIPGVTVKPELFQLVQASVAEYYYNLAPAVGEVAAGDDFNTSNAGSKKAILTLTAGLHVDEKIPNVAIDSMSPDVVMDVMVKASLALSNKLGAKFITALKALAQAGTYTKGLNMYAAIVEALGTFSGASSVNVGGVADVTYSNRQNGIQPNFIMVGDTGRSKLYNTDAFQRTINATGQIRVIGEILGLTVVYSQDLTDVDFIMGYSEGIAFPYSINTLRVVESENFNGVRVQGEVGYPVQGYGILPIDSHAIKFTESLT